MAGNQRRATKLGVAVLKLEALLNCRLLRGNTLLELVETGVAWHTRSQDAKRWSFARQQLLFGGMKTSDKVGASIVAHTFLHVPATAFETSAGIVFVGPGRVAELDDLLNFAELTYASHTSRRCVGV